MSPYDLHESVNKNFATIIASNFSRMGIVDDDICSIELDTNSRLLSADIYHIPDLMLSLSKISDEPSDTRIFPLWLLETAFSQDRREVVEKLIAMTDPNPSVHFCVLVKIEDDALPFGDSSAQQRAAIAAQQMLSEEEFIALCKGCPPFGPLVVKGAPWMNITCVTFEAFLRNPQGCFDFESEDPPYSAKGVSSSDTETTSIS
jgi:hypothetical protein